MEIFLVLFFVLFFAAVIKSIGQWFKNENSPRLTVPVIIVDKRRKTHHHRSNGHHHHSHSYHVTFQVESGDHMELRVLRNEYERLSVGDGGLLSFQGTRYLEFERKDGSEHETVV